MTALSSIDIYKRRMPMFNLRGKESVGSFCGGICTLMVLTVLLIFGVIKLNHLLSKYNPNVS